MLIPFTLKGQNITKTVYVKVLQTEVKPCNEIMVLGRLHFFQQDKFWLQRVPTFHRHVLEGRYCKLQNMYKMKLLNRFSLIIF